MVSIRKADGTVSKTMAWNAAAITILGMIGAASEMLPLFQELMKPWHYIAIAIVMRGVDIFLRQITSQPMK